MLTDESTCKVSPTKNRMQVWKKCRQSSHPEHIVSTFNSVYQNVAVREDSICKLTPLVGIAGSFDRNSCPVIIDNKMLPFMYDVHNAPVSFVLLLDNCGPSRATCIADYLSIDEVVE